MYVLYVGDRLATYHYLVHTHKVHKIVPAYQSSAALFQFVQNHTVIIDSGCFEFNVPRLTRLISAGNDDDLVGLIVSIKKNTDSKL